MQLPEQLNNSGAKITHKMCTHENGLFPLYIIIIIINHLHFVIRKCNYSFNDRQIIH